MRFYFEDFFIDWHFIVNCFNSAFTWKMQVDSIIMLETLYLHAILLACKYNQLLSQVPKHFDQGCVPRALPPPHFFPWMYISNASTSQTWKHYLWNSESHWDLLLLLEASSLGWRGSQSLCSHGGNFLACHEPVFYHQNWQTRLLFCPVPHKMIRNSPYFSCYKCSLCIRL